MIESIFREYDIRGKYPDEINETMAYTIGRSYGSYIFEKFGQIKCVVSMDNRLSSESLKNNLINGITDSGVGVIDFGLTTTPMNFYARYAFSLFGVMITASHNPKDDNGFKFSFGGPSNAKGAEIVDFKNYTFKGIFNVAQAKGTYEVCDITQDYINFLISGISPGEKNLKIVVDPGNGSASPFIRRIFQNFNIDLTIINEENDGTFPNHHPDPADKKNLEQLKIKVLEIGADIGIAYDGDGDRVGFIKDNGDYLSIEDFMITIIRDLSLKVENKKFLYDVKCSKTVEEEILQLHCEPLLYRTGASYTQSKVHEDNLPFGGEFSGHIFFRDRIYDVGSAIYASLRLIEILTKSDKKISQLTQNIPKYPITEEIKIPTSDKNKFEIIEKIKELCREKRFNINDIDGIKIKFKEGWALIRASNTGPNIIFRAEANTDAEKEKLKQYFEKIINQYNTIQ